MPFPDKDGAGYHSIHRAQESQRALLELESRGIPSQSEIVKAKRFSQSDGAELPVDRIRIVECRTLCSNRDVDLLFGDGERKFELRGFLQLYGLHQRFETISQYSYRIGPGFYIWRGKLPGCVRRQHDRLS